MKNLNFKDNTFDAITAGFGVRNFENLDKGLEEMFRVMKHGGKVAILEPTEPRLFPMKQLYTLYFNVLLPTIGKFFQKINPLTNIYQNLYQNSLAEIILMIKLRKAGFKKPKFKSLTFGIAALYTATK